MPNKPKASKKPTIAVFKFASCDGCQLSLLDCEDELLAVTGAVEIAFFPEASRVMKPGPYTVTLVEGSITTPHDMEQIQKIRKETQILIAIGACATAGGIQALRNFKNVKDFVPMVYSQPEFIDPLDKSVALADAVKVDFELRGCPINKYQLLEVVNALLNGRKPNTPTYSVCVECKRRGTPCVMVSQGRPCMGPVTQAGCGAICPSFNRGCYACFGPKETPNPASLSGQFKKLGMSEDDLVRVYRTFNAGAEPFVKESETHEK